MPFCLKHYQTYNMDEYCIYCGKPETFTVTNATSAEDIDKILDRQRQRFYYGSPCFVCFEPGGHGNLPCPKLKIKNNK